MKRSCIDNPSLHRHDVGDKTSLKSSELDDAVPSRFVCPLTLEVMRYPLMTRAGHSFERTAILSWLRRNDSHPLTREPLSPRDLVMNRALQAEIQAWSKYRNAVRKKRLAAAAGCGESETETSSQSSGDVDNLDAFMLDEEQFLFISTTGIDRLESRLNFAQRSDTTTNVEDEEEQEATTTTTTSSSSRRPRFAFRRRNRR